MADRPTPPPARRRPRRQREEHYPYLHPEHLHSEPLAVSPDDLYDFIEHYGDEGPDIVSDVQPG